MIDSQKAKIRKGSPRRSPVCYRTTRDIVIPAGTVLRDDGDALNHVEADIGLGGVIAAFSVPVCSEAVASGYFDRVAA